MLPSSELKTLAKQQLAGNWLNAIIAFAIFGAVTTIVSCTFVGVLAVTGPFCVALAYLGLKWANGEKADLGDFFSALKINLTNSIIAGAVWTLAVCIGLVLFVIPGFYLMMAYSQTFFLLHDNPEMGWGDALNKSKEMMDGHKMELFGVFFSFIGWMILVVITFGLAGFYVTPYMEQTLTNYYLQLKKESGTAPANDAPAVS